MHAPASAPPPWRLGPPTRRLRLAAGLVLLTYVALHLINHALLLVSLPAANAMLVMQKFLWRGLIGTALLYGAALTHAGLGLGALYARRNFARPWLEGLQMALGLALPTLIANHIAVTRLAYTFHDIDKSYPQELFALWVAEPFWGWVQVAVLLVAWTHAMIGLWQLLRLRPWWPRAAPAALAFALLLPMLALLGFSEGGRAVARLRADPGFHAAFLTASHLGTAAQKAHLAAIRRAAIAAYLGLIALVLLARLLRGLVETRARRVTIAYPDGTKLRITRGLTVLEASRRGRIPHANVCGGRGRCSTCRIRILANTGRLPPPGHAEARILTAIGANSGAIRLACQLRPAADLAIVPLIPPALAPAFVLGAPRLPQREQFVAAMFVDLRNSTRLATHCLPFDGLFLLGNFLSETATAITAQGGKVVQFLGDGVLALFGLHTPPAAACRAALAALPAIAAAAARLAPLFAQEAGCPLGYGIGLACGPALVGEIGVGETLAFTALGETVNLAHRLQEMARESGIAAAVMARVFTTAALPPPSEPDIATPRGHAPIARHLLPGTWAPPAPGPDP